MFVRIYCCLSGGEDRDFDEAVVSFSFPSVKSLPANISISVYSDVPVFLAGSFIL